MIQKLKSIFDSEFSHLEASAAFRTLGIALVTIFIPVSLYQRGITLDHIFTYYIALYCTWMLMMPLVMVLYHYFGIKNVMSYSSLLLIGYIYLTQNITSIEMLYAVAVLGGIAKSIYWLGFYTEFNRTSEHKEVEHAGLDKIISGFLEAGSTFTAGLIISIFSVQALLVFSTVCFVISFFMLHIDPDEYPHREFEINTLKSVVKNKLNHKSMFAFTVDGMEYIGLAVIWPLYIFIETNDFVLTGGIVIVSFMISTIFIAMVARWKDKIQSFLRYGALVDAAGWLFKSLVSGSFLLAVAHTTHDLSRSMFSASYSGKMHLNANRDGHRYHYFALNEIGKAAGKTLVLSSLLFLPNMQSVFVLLAGMTWVYFLI